METELSVWGIEALICVWIAWCSWMCPWTLSRFLECNVNLATSWKACNIQHPLNPALALPEVLDAAIQFRTTQGFQAVAKCRVEFFKKWHARAKELEQKEFELRSQMDEHVNKAVQGKRL